MTDYKAYLYEVYREKSFSKAAQKLFVSQPWLSATVKKVEQELGLPLFDRSTSPISLTDAGRYYMEQIQRIMSIEEEMREHFQALRHTQRVQLQIGSSMFFCTYVLPVLLKDFTLQYPQVTLTFTEGSNKTLTEKLLAGQLDLMLEAEQPVHNRLESVLWASEEIVLAVPARYGVNQDLKEYRYTFEEFLSRTGPDRRKPAVPLASFAKETFILLKEGNDIHQRSLQLCRKAGFTPNVSLYVAQMMTAYYLVLEGQGIAFLRSTIPEYVAPTDQVVFYQMEDPLAVRSIYLSYARRNANSMQQRLIDFMKQNI